MSAYSFSNLPEVVPADTYEGKVLVPTEADHGRVVVYDDHKETVANPEKETVLVENFPEPFDEERGREAVPVTTEPPLSQKPQQVKERLNRKFCGIRAKWALLGLALLILLIFVLGVGLGVGLRSG